MWPQGLQDSPQGLSGSQQMHGPWRNQSILKRCKNAPWCVKFSSSGYKMANAYSCITDAWGIKHILLTQFLISLFLNFISIPSYILWTEVLQVKNSELNVRELNPQFALLLMQTVTVVIGTLNRDPACWIFSQDTADTQSGPSIKFTSLDCLAVLMIPYKLKCLQALLRTIYLLFIL